MLTIKIDVEQSAENLRAVLDSLQDFEVVSTSWEESEADLKASPKIRVTRDGDPTSALSAAINSARRNSGQ